MTPTPLGYFEAQWKLLGTDASLLGQQHLGKAPEGFDAVDARLGPIPFHSGNGCV
jgi:hypothetical protein